MVNTQTLSLLSLAAVVIPEPNSTLAGLAVLLVLIGISTVGGMV